MLDLMLFQAVVFITQVSAKKDTCSQQLKLKSAFWGPRMFSCSYTGEGSRGEKRDQVKETLGGLLKEEPRDKILSKDNQGHKAARRRSPGRYSSSASPFAGSFWRGKSQLWCSAGQRGKARLELHSSIIPVLGM